MSWVMVARSSAKKTLPMPGKEYDVRLALLMPWPVQPDCQPSRTSWSWLATGIAALAVEVSSGPKM
jgi:hypothetical protein